MTQNEPPRTHAKAKRGEKLTSKGVYLLPGETKLIAVSGQPDPKDKLGTTNDWEDFKRWLRWNVLCLRGRKCAEIELTNAAEIPRGGEVCIEYTCEGCGTRYLFSSKHGRSRR